MQADKPGYSFGILPIPFRSHFQDAARVSLYAEKPQSETRMLLTRSLKRALPLAAVLLAAGFTACGDDDDPAGPAGNTVSMTATAFTPAALTIARNESVTWTNPSGVLHNVTFSTNGSPANIPDHTSGSNARTFANAGSYAYSCTNHENMNGTIVVQ